MLRSRTPLATGLLLAVTVGCSGGPRDAPPPGSTEDSGSTGPASEAGNDVVSGDASSDGTQAAAESGATTDAPNDAPHATGIPALVGCLGTSKPMTLSGQMPYVDVLVGGVGGEFLLDFATTFSSIDLSAFPSAPITTGCNPTLLGELCTVPGFAFFGPTGTVTLTTEDFSGIGGSVRQAGIVGTDLLSEQIITVNYAGSSAFAATEVAFCSEAALASAGFAPLTTAGFYEQNLANLEPYTDVDGTAAAGSSVPDVPTVPVTIGGVSALAQLDTGFDDDVTKFSVNINVAFFMAIQASAASTLVRDSALDTSLSTCVEGVSESVQAYRLAPGAALDFVAEDSTNARTYPGAVVFVKNTPAVASQCGGIGTWTVPAAQVAASYFNDMGAVVFDPFGARVWIPKGP